MENKKNSNNFPVENSDLLINSKLNWNTPEVVDLDINKTLGGPDTSNTEQHSSPGNAAS